MKAIDTSVLIIAVITSSRHHDRAGALLQDMSEGGRPWAIPWSCVHEFLRIVTHPRVFHPPVPLDLALSDITGVLASPSPRLLQEAPRHPAVMAGVLRESRATGNLIHDAHIAALCIEHGVSELITEDRDFRRFPDLEVADPFQHWDNEPERDPSIAPMSEGLHPTGLDPMGSCRSHG